MRNVMQQAIVPANGGPFSMLVWSSDSKSALIVKAVLDPNPSTEVWQVFVDGREARKLDDPLDARLKTGGIRMHPDGRRIALWGGRPQQKSPAQIVKLENFLPSAAARR